MFTDSPVSWGRVSRALHWGTVVLLAVEVPLGLVIADLSEAYGAGRDEAATSIAATAAHHTLGFVALLVVLVRLNWRLNNVRPTPPPLGPLRRRLAQLTQLGLVACLFALPLTGWAALTTAPDDLPIYVLGWELPRMYEEPPASSFAHDLFAALHGWGWMVGGLLLAVHVTGASWSQWGESVPVVRRMWSGVPFPPDGPTA